MTNTRKIDLTASANIARHGQDLSRRSFMGKAAALAVGSSIGGLSVASPASAAPQKGGILRAGMLGGATSDSLDPALFSSQVPLTFGRCWAEQLLEVTPDGELEPRLAESFEWGDAGKKWIFKIRRDVTFHHGKTLTPQDVVDTYRRHMDPDTASTGAAMVSSFEDIRADGDNVIITLNEANADLPYLLTDFHMMIQPNGGYDAEDYGIGTGPYRVAVEEPGVIYGGERYSDYWAPDDRGHADQIEILVINDSTSRMAALRSGQVDIVNQVEPHIAREIAGGSNITLRNIAGRGHYYMVMFCDTPPFESNDLRLALKYAINRQEMVEKILDGFGQVGNDTPIMNAYPYFSADIAQREYDPDRAAFHYRKSGVSSPIVLNTSEVAFPGAVDAATLFSNSAQRAGIPLEVKRNPADGYWSEVWNKEPFSSTFVFGRPTQDQILSLFYLSTAEWNDTHFYREDFDRLVLGARGELDPELRKEMYHDASVILQDEGGAIIPMFGDYLDATGPRVGGWYDNNNAELMGGQALIQCWVND